MNRTLSILVFLACVYLSTIGTPALSQQSFTDAFALAETKADLPPNWDPWPDGNKNGETALYSEHKWMGRREYPQLPVSHQNHILVSAFVRIWICKSDDEAQDAIERLYHGPGQTQVPQQRGAYFTGSVGDSSTHSPISANSGFLRFRVRNAVFSVNVGGPEGDYDYPVEAMKIARVLEARAYAVLALGGEDIARILLRLAAVLAGKSILRRR